MNECPEEIFFQDEENDLSYWEFINSADSDADDVLSLSDASWHSSISSSPKESPIADMIQDSDGGLPHRDYESFHDDKYGFHELDRYGRVVCRVSTLQVQVGTPPPGLDVTRKS
ncbi:hypothetical protein CCACVL1_16786 [Corchorus capsularis]|uniref:Uncharacterized protein n=1 Tax=Corchorus capsularis TaxID=210143 RepID=A0A1R3HVW6_COCAP|nr:hypothetical protein CCACVL1_16786 [Corchorus capsularis]